MGFARLLSIRLSHLRASWLLAILMLATSTSAVQAAQLRISLQDAETGLPLEDAVVEVHLPIVLQNEFSSTSEYSVDQVEKEFIDNVTVVNVGSRVFFPNSDDILHHVYSFSPAKVFELPLYGNGRSVDFSQIFDQVGIVELGCNIHDWMLGYIYVAETTLVVKTDANGQALIEGVPEGVLSVSIWHPRASHDSDALQHSIEFDDAQPSTLRMALSLERDNRLRRAPNVSRSRYR